MTLPTIDISESVATLIKLVFKQGNAPWPGKVEAFEQNLVTWDFAFFLLQKI